MGLKVVIHKPQSWKHKVLLKYLYLKMCFSNSMGHLQFPNLVLEKFLMVAVFLKVFGIDNYTLVGVVFGLVTIWTVWLGHLLLKHGIIDAEVSMSNQFNPELKELVRKARGR